jgi:acyl-CoA thioester hydrolase
MADPFNVRVAVRGYELDMNGHLNQAVYLQYAEHARWESVRAAGISLETLRAVGIAPIVLETTLRSHHELRDGDEVDVSCVFDWGAGRTCPVRQEVRRADGLLAAEITSIVGLLDLAERRLITDPAERLLSVAAVPEVLGL